MKGSKSRKPTMTDQFAYLRDPRVERTKKHLLHDIVVITICAVIGGADDWVNIARFARAKRKWFKSFLSLPNGIASHDTLGRVFAALDPTELTRCFSSWISSLVKVTQGEVVAIDG